MSGILDVCCGSRMMWFDKSAPICGDIRREVVVVVDRSHGKQDGTRTVRIEPDVIFDFRALPFADNSVHLIAFDPPHLVRAGARSFLAAKYGKLGTDWREDLRRGFEECWRVLRPHGTLVFKWNDTQVPLSEVLQGLPQKPMFGNTSGRKAGTHWLVFFKGHP